MPLRTFSGRFVAVVGGVLVFASRLWGGFLRLAYTLRP